MSTRCALVTGSSGGIGSVIARTLHDNGWFVIGIDQSADPKTACDAFVTFDLRQSSDPTRLEKDCMRQVTAALGERKLSALINNAATQILGRTDAISAANWQDTLTVNLTAPLMLSQAFLEDLRSTRGCILNIGSVHAKATKPGFVAYATSKAGLHGMTRALAIDLGPDVRVLCLAPAAIATSMLQAGFTGRGDAMERLESCHPAGRIGSPEAVGRAAAFLLSDNMPFLTGTTFYLDGGVLARLHDPE